MELTWTRMPTIDDTIRFIATDHPHSRYLIEGRPAETDDGTRTWQAIEVDTGAFIGPGVTYLAEAKRQVSDHLDEPTALDELPTPDPEQRPQPETTPQTGLDVQAGDEVIVYSKATYRGSYLAKVTAVDGMWIDLVHPGGQRTWRMNRISQATGVHPDHWDFRFRTVDRQAATPRTGPAPITVAAAMDTVLCLARRLDVNSAANGPALDDLADLTGRLAEAIATRAAVRSSSVIAEQHAQAAALPGAQPRLQAVAEASAASVETAHAAAAAAHLRLAEAIVAYDPES